jgi:very-short-patch-repair endonuclease
MFRRRRQPDVDAAPDARRRHRPTRTAPPDVDARVAALAERQDGLVTREELLALPLSPSAIGGRVRSRRLHIVFRGVYAVGHRALSDRALLRAALLAVGPHAVLSHRTAAFLWGLVRELAATIDVLVLGTPPRSRPGLRVHQTRLPFVAAVHDDLRVTSPLRTLQDLCAEPDFSRLCSEALALRLVTQRELDEAGLGHPDAAPTPSEFGRRFHAILRTAGLPRPLTEHQIGRYTADFAWPEQRVIVETDGFASHGHRSAFEHDRARDAYLLARGWVVMRVTWRRLRREPTRVVAELAQVLAVRETSSAREARAQSRR